MPTLYFTALQLDSVIAVILFFLVIVSAIQSAASSQSKEVRGRPQLSAIGIYAVPRSCYSSFCGEFSSMTASSYFFAKLVDESLIIFHPSFVFSATSK